MSSYLFCIPLVVLHINSVGLFSFINFWKVANFPKVEPDTITVKDYSVFFIKTPPNVLYRTIFLIVA